VIEPNDFVLVNSVIESRDAIFDENRFKSVLSKSPVETQTGNSVMENENDQDIVEVPELRMSKRAQKVKSFGSSFFTFLVEGNRESMIRQIPYYFNIEVDPQTFEEIMKD